MSVSATRQHRLRPAGFRECPQGGCRDQIAVLEDLLPREQCRHHGNAGQSNEGCWVAIQVTIYIYMFVTYHDILLRIINIHLNTFYDMLQHITVLYIIISHFNILWRIIALYI